MRLVTDQGGEGRAVCGQVQMSRWVLCELSQRWEQGQSQQSSLLWGRALSATWVTVNQGSLPGGGRVVSGFTNKK